MHVRQGIRPGVPGRPHHSVRELLADRRTGRRDRAVESGRAGRTARGGGALRARGRRGAPPAGPGRATRTGPGRRATARPGRPGTSRRWPGRCGAAAPWPGSAARFALARRLLGLAADLGERGGDVVVRGYSLAGLAETGRIQGDYEAVGRLHEQLLAEARRRGEARHTVWALEGIAQMHRNTGALRHGVRACSRRRPRSPRGADDRRGHAWALRGLADVVSVRDGDTERALALLSEAETTCRAMKLSSALAYNHKMRGNVLLPRRALRRGPRAVRAGARGVPCDERAARGGAVPAGTRQVPGPAGPRPLPRPRPNWPIWPAMLERIGLRHAREMVARAQEEFGCSRRRRR